MTRIRGNPEILLHRDDLFDFAQAPKREIISMVEKPQKIPTWTTWQ
jgi:hypothetical protein